MSEEYSSPGQKNLDFRAPAEAPLSFRTSSDGFIHEDAALTLDTNLLRLYINQIRRYPRLTKEEEVSLGQKMESFQSAYDRVRDTERIGRIPIDQDIRHARKYRTLKDRFIRGNLGLVVNIAKRYPTFPGWDMLDNIQEGNIGLEHAVTKFDWRKDATFSEQCGFIIRKAIKRAIIRKGTTINVSTDFGEAMHASIRRANRDNLDLTKKQKRFIDLTTRLHILKWEDENYYMTELSAGPEEIAIVQIEHDEAREALSRLDSRTRYILEQYFEGRLQRDISTEFGLTRRAIGKIIAQGLGKLGETLD